jgi:two-component system, NtrC family, response regulator HydG
MSEKLRILIVDDDQRMAGTLKDILNAKGYEADADHSGPEALKRVAQTHFDCILTDIKMPGMNGVDLYKVIKQKQPDIPVVLMTAYSTDKLVKEGLEQGAIASLTKPLDINALLTFFSSLRKERSVLIVDDDPKFCKTLGDILKGRGFVVTEVTDPHGVMERIKPDSQIVLLDMKLNNVGGLEVLKQIKEQYPHLPVILVTGYRDEMKNAIEYAMKIGAHTYLYKPFEIDDLLQHLTEIHRKQLAKVLG